MTIRNTNLNILIGLNSFIIFFLFFEESIQVPAYLQVVGRLHPLLLHFPIVLLFISWLLIIFRKHLEKNVPTLKSIISRLVYFSAVLAGLTVIMGLLLSKEGGYEGNSYDWHKYSGVALSLLALGLAGYTIQKQNRYHPLFIMGMNLSLVLLLSVGHFGATLTHGENFVLAPLDKGKSGSLDMERAVLFEDAILPILETKCMSCHNGSKPKGGLVLSDTASIVAGGKNGKLFDLVSPFKSLFVERLLLDINHKHRMPPKGKPQLTEGELALLQAWVSKGATFALPLSALGKNDSLFQAVKLVYGIDDTERYDFSPADGSAVSALATPYRIIKPLANGSPALAVNFYGRDFYEPESLTALMPIANQVVSMNLSSMPVEAKDLAVLKSFKNLRELNLNYTALKDGDLAILPSLSSLKSLNLSGTAITASGLQSLLAMASLRKLFAWNTSVNEQDVLKLNKEFPMVYIHVGSKEDTVKLPLTAPKILPSRSFFRKEIPVNLTHPIAGVNIHYTLDGSDPDSTAPLYEKTLLIDRNMTLRVKAVKEGWLQSEELKQLYVNAPIMPDNVNLDTRPHRLYRGNEGHSLFDLESGGPNTMDGKWIAFQQSELSANLFFDTPQHIDTLSLSVRQGYHQHIYPPQYIEIWGGADSTNVRLLAKVSPSLDQIEQVRYRRMLSVPIHAGELGYIKFKAIPYQKIPAGYPAGGNPGWIFMDELVIK